MRFENKEIKLKNGKKCFLIPIHPSMAADMIKYRKKMTEETYYSIFNPDEIDENVEYKERHIIYRLVDSYKIEMVAVYKNKILGTCYVSEVAALRKTRHRASLSISVLKKYWNLGVGTAMMDYMIEIARNVGYSQIDIEVVTDNERAINLYRKLGFIETGRRHNSIRLDDGTYRDEIIMYLKL